MGTLQTRALTACFLPAWQAVNGHSASCRPLGPGTTGRHWRTSQQAGVRREFAAGVPGAAGRPFVQADIYLLLAAAEIHAKDAALAITRLRATGLMLRNCSVPFLAASAVALAEAATGHQTAVSVICTVLFAAAALSALRAGKRLRIWEVSKTLQVCYWIPEIDETIRQGSAAPRQRRPRSARWPT
jgi:hypothetical protein